jgi:hypothetical protein
LCKLGAEPVVADALDRQAIQAAVKAPDDAIVRELTDLKGASDLRTFDRPLPRAIDCGQRALTIVGRRTRSAFNASLAQSFPAGG